MYIYFCQKKSICLELNPPLYLRDGHARAGRVAERSAGVAGGGVAGGGCHWGQQLFHLIPWSWYFSESTNGNTSSATWDSFKLCSSILNWPSPLLLIRLRDFWTIFVLYIWNNAQLLKGFPPLWNLYSECFSQMKNWPFCVELIISNCGFWAVL